MAIRMRQGLAKALKVAETTDSSLQERVARVPVGLQGKGAPGKGHKMFNATEAKNRFGAIMKLVDKSEPVFIEKHGTARAVVLDIASYSALLAKARGPEERQLQALEVEFQEMYAAMQSAKSRAGVDALLTASAEEINKRTAARPKSRG